MNRLLLATLLLCGAAWLLVQENNPGRAQNFGGSDIGPQDGQAVLKLPGSEAPASQQPKPAVSPATNPYAGLTPTPAPGTGNASGSKIMDLWKNPYTGDRSPQPSAPGGKFALAKLAPHEGPDPNQDIQVTPAQGPWVISIMTYTGTQAPQLARELAMELRNTYKLSAFVFNHGTEERRKEYERVKTLIEQQKKFLQESNLTPDQPIRIRYTHIDEQCAVLVGGYADDNAARRALDNIKKMPPPDTSKVHLHTKFYEKRDPKNPEKVERVERVYVNPFQHAFVARNPTTKTNRPGEWDKPDLAVLKRLNAEEPYSLLQCKKAYTLAIKQFQTPTVIQARSATGSFLENLGLGGKATDHTDGAAMNAHELARLLREAKLEAYVLHTKYSSVVTVGQFDSLDDPNLRATQNLLSTRLKLTITQLFPTPLPMQVPR